METEIEIAILGELFNQKKIGGSYIPLQRITRLLPMRYRSQASSALSTLHKKMLLIRHKQDCWSLSALGVRLARRYIEAGEFTQVITAKPRSASTIKTVNKIFKIGKGWMSHFDIENIEPTDDLDTPSPLGPRYKQRVTASFHCPLCQKRSTVEFTVGLNDLSKDMSVWCEECGRPVYRCTRNLSVLGYWDEDERGALVEVYKQILEDQNFCSIVGLKHIQAEFPSVDVHESWRKFKESVTTRQE